MLQRQKTFSDNLEEMKALIESMSGCVGYMRANYPSEKKKFSPESQPAILTTVVNELVEAADQEKMDEIRSLLKSHWAFKKVRILSFHLLIRFPL